MILDDQSPLTALPAMGGKGANLYRLTKAGFPVPAWVCISSEVFPQVLPNPPLTHFSLPLNVQQQLAGWLKPDQFYAVRSSALAEDGSLHSWAGQLKTWLYVMVADVPATIVACWQASADASVQDYLAATGLRQDALKMAVIVQEMVNSQAAGVMFTANPVGDLSELVIVAGYGLGEGIVADQVATDHYIYQRWQRQWQEQIGHKTEQISWDQAHGKGTCKTSVPLELQQQPVLTVEQRTCLLEWGERLRQLYGQEQDVEWAFTASGQVYLLQSRPITTLPQGGRLLFDNSNVVESYPGLTLPFTFSYIQAAYARLFYQAVRALGVSRQRLTENQAIFQHMLGHLKGRVYYNLTHWYAMFRLLPGTEGYISVWQEMMGIQATAPQAAVGRSVRLALWWQWTRVGSRLFWFWLTLTPAMQRFHQRCTQVHQHFYQQPLAQVEHQELYRRYCALETALFPGWEITLFNDGFAFVFTALAKKMLKRLQPEQETTWFNALMCGDTELASAQPVRQLVALAEIVRADPELHHQLHLFDREPEQLTLWLNHPDTHQTFAHTLRQYLSTYGDRSWAELKLETLTLRESPIQLIQLLLRYAASDLTVAHMSQHETEIHQQAAQAVRQAFGWHKFGYWCFCWLLGQARRSIQYRESSRLERARIFGMVRTLARQAGRLLARDKVLQQPEDVFYLTMAEVWSYFHGGSANRHLQPLVAQRQQDWQAYAAISLAERVLCQGIPDINLLPIKTQPQADLSQLLTGTPCAAGIVRGEVCPVRDPATAGDVQGKILVAEMTDPGWVFLMVAATGLIVEKGSMLSHTAIIGRELGIPTVVGVTDAMARLPVGTQVELNGLTGEIRIL